jgi:hypothetical protein
MPAQNPGSVSDSRTISMTTGAAPALSLNEADISRIANLLAKRIGPVARTLVRRELGKSSSLEQLVSSLALSIPDETERGFFKDEMAVDSN